MDGEETEEQPYLELIPEADDPERDQKFLERVRKLSREKLPGGLEQRTGCAGMFALLSAGVVSSGYLIHEAVRYFTS